MIKLFSIHQFETFFAMSCLKQKSLFLMPIPQENPLSHDLFFSFHMLCIYITPFLMITLFFPWLILTIYTCIWLLSPLSYVSYTFYCSMPDDVFWLGITWDDSHTQCVPICWLPFLLFSTHMGAWAMVCVHLNLVSWWSVHILTWFPDSPCIAALRYIKSTFYIYSP